MMLVKTSIRNSSIEGVGVFAEEFIPAGTVIWRLDERFDLFFSQAAVASFPPHMREYFNRYSYPHMQREGLVVFELDNGRFMNHSDSPNTDFSQPDIGVATADIRIGEEITCNYFEFDASFHGFGHEANGLLHGQELGHAMSRDSAVAAGIHATGEGSVNAT